jgi:hypothetical protein
VGAVLYSLYFLGCPLSYELLLCFDLLATKKMMIQLVNAIAQYDAKLKTPIMTNVFHLAASGKSPNMEMGTTIPTKIDKASVTLKDPKTPFPLFTPHISLFNPLSSDT